MTVPPRQVPPTFPGHRLFTHVQVKDLPRIDMDANHVYTYKGRRYKSVTTVLRALPNPGLERWKRIELQKHQYDQAAADKYVERHSGDSMRVGTELHRLFELYLNNRLFREIHYTHPPDHPQGYAFNPWTLFQQAVPYVNNIDMISGVEQRLISTRWHLAGTADVVGEFNGRSAIIDHKNARSYRRPDIREKYMLQTAIYGIMWQEMTGRRVDDLVVLIHRWDGKSDQYVEKFDDLEPVALDFLENHPQVEPEPPLKVVG